MNCRSIAVCVSCFALLAVAGAPVALAQEVRVEKKALKGAFDKPIKGKEAARPGEKRSVMSMSSNDGENSYALRIEDGEVSAKVNGEEVPAERIRREDGKVIILDEKGKTLKEFSVDLGDGPHAFGWGPEAGGEEGIRIHRFGQGMGGEDGEARAFAFGGPGQNAALFGGEEPKVMLGITMSAADEGGIIVDSVVEGLPAAAAGIKEGDRIVSIDGEELGETDAIREALADKEAGDEIKVELVRDGKNQTITVKLAKFDQSKFGRAGMREDGPATGFRMDPQNQFGGVRAELENTLRRLSNDPEFKDAFRSDEVRKQIRESLQRAIEGLEQAQHSMGEGYAEMLERRMVPGQQGGMVFDNNRPGMVFRVPAAPEAPRAMGSEMDARLEKLMKKLEKLDGRLEALEKKLNER